MTAIDAYKAATVLRTNDRGGYTVPAHGLYPFQWSWDSAITALGWLRLDEPRAWKEADSMFRGQWANGMVPHILFHKDAESYFPGPDVWGGNHPIPSSAISQPPLWATVIRMLYENCMDRSQAEQNLTVLVPKLVAYHRWWYNERDPEKTGLVCSYHPWESGMDNSPAWDRPLENVPEVDWSYQRRDLSRIDLNQRPKKPEYDRYLYLVDFYKRHNFDSAEIFKNCPYKVLDVGIIAILHQASSDLLHLCKVVSFTDGIDEISQGMVRTESAVDSLWSGEHRCFLSYDVLTAAPLEEITTATVLPMFGGLASEQQAREMIELISEWLDSTAYGLSSAHPSSDSYEPQRYWRGPVWLHINWLIALGLSRYGAYELAECLRDSSRRCVVNAGFWENFDAGQGTGCGGGDFSWTAAIALFWLDQ